MATSPTPSLDSIRGTNSIESYGEHNDYLSDSPLTLSGSSPPVSDSAICDDFSSSGATSSIDSQHPVSSVSSSASSTSSSSGLSCGSGSGIISNETGGNGASPCNGIISNNVISITTSNGSTVPRCTACKSKQSDAVAKCFECVNFLCSNCATAHEFMHCFNGHNVCLISGFENSLPTSALIKTPLPNLSEIKFSSSLSMMLQAQQQQPPQKQLTSQLSKIIINANAYEAGLTHNQFNSTKEEILPKLSISSSLSSNVTEILPQNSSHLASTNNKVPLSSQYFCSRHKAELLTFFCRTCCVLICKNCITTDHSSGLHEVEHSQEIAHKQSDSIMQSIVTELRGKVGEIISVVTNSDSNMCKIKMQYQKAHNEINETYQFFCSMLDERKHELLKELESLYNSRVSSNNSLITRSKELVEKVIQSCDSIERSAKTHNISDILMLRKTLDIQHQSSLQELQVPFELEFVSNYQSIQVGVRNTFGYIRATSEATATIQKQPPIARPTQSLSTSNVSNNNNISCFNLSANVLDNPFSNLSNNVVSVHNGGINSSPSFDNNLISKRFQTNTFGAFVNDVNMQINPYEKWSNGGSDNLFNGITDQYSISLTSSNCNNGVNSVNALATTTVNSLTSSNGSDSIIGLTSKILSATIYPPKSQIKRQKMIYHCKFGEFGVMEGQFTEPSGVAVNAQNDIIVADTNNHRIQIFDKEGRFKFQFGECGKRDSQLLYPNRVAVVKTSGDIIVTERSPTHQIQIYNQYGQFVRKFGANILQHPRGVTVDNKGRIIVVECKVMRVIIFDQNGNVIQKFGCSKHLEFPNGVVVNDKQEIFISDNRAHCVKVFNYDGQYLRQIGGEGVTNYPIGVGINTNGEILIADNHNNFNLTIFTQDGQLVSALESKVKHAQCFDVALMDDGSVVLASKDYRLYIYRYVQVPPIGL